MRIVYTPEAFPFSEPLLLSPLLLPSADAVLFPWVPDGAVEEHPANPAASDTHIPNANHFFIDLIIATSVICIFFSSAFDLSIVYKNKSYKSIIMFAIHISFLAAILLI